MYVATTAAQSTRCLERASGDSPAREATHIVQPTDYGVASLTGVPAAFSLTRERNHVLIACVGSLATPIFPSNLEGYRARRFETGSNFGDGTVDAAGRRSAGGGRSYAHGSPGFVLGA